MTSNTQSSTPPDPPTDQGSTQDNQWSPRRIQALWGYFFLLPWVLGFLLFWAGPMVASLYLSLTDYSIRIDKDVEFIGLDNYKDLFRVKAQTEIDKSEDFPVYTFQRPDDTEAQAYIALVEDAGTTTYINRDDPTAEPFELKDTAIEARDPLESVSLPVYRLPAYGDGGAAAEGRAREHVLIKERPEGDTLWLTPGNEPIPFPDFPDGASRAEIVPFTQEGYREFLGIGPVHFGAYFAGGEAKNNAYRFWKSLTVTLIYAAVSLPLTLALALFFALLTNTEVPGVTVFRTLFYLPTVIPHVVAATVFLKFLQDDGGWLNTYLLDSMGINGPDWLHDPQWAIPALAMISTWGIGTAMLMFLAGLQNIPTELYEAARVDGANYFHRFRHVTLPMISPVLLYNMVIGLVGTFQYFAIAYTLAYAAVTNPYGNDYSMTFYNTNIYQSAYVEGYMGGASALAWILLLIVMGITLLVFKSSGRWVFYAGGGNAS